MISPISAYTPLSYSYYNLSRNNPTARSQTAQAQNVPNTANAGKTQAAPQAGMTLSAQRAASPELPVQPVNPVTAVNGGETQPVQLGIPIREGADPVEMAVRMRIRYDDPEAEGAVNPTDAQKGDHEVGAEAVQEAAEEGKCETCENRKYQDGSNDMSVSYQTPTRIAPEQVASAVRGHEMEHVSHEQAKAQQNDRKVVSQSVTLHTNICPECGKTYISGGTTRTVTAANQQQEVVQQEEANQKRTPFAAVA